MAHDIVALIVQHGLLVVFLSVLVAKAGTPVPAVPTLAVAGALAADGQLPIAGILLVALAACLIDDLLWYAAGRRFGAGLLRLLCRISLSPDSCVRHAGGYFERWHGKLLLVSKFLPGVSMMAATLMGAMRLPLRVFVLFDGLGSLLWAGVAVGLGYLFATQIDAVLIAILDTGKVAARLLLGVLALYVLAKWWWRRRLLLALRIPRITAEELMRSLGSEPPSLVIDVRSRTSRQLDPRVIPGALLARFDRVGHALHGVPLDSKVATYCDCPNDTSSAQAAKTLMKLGYLSVFPLQGGLSAWVAAGYPVERLLVSGGVAPTTSR